MKKKACFFAKVADREVLGRVEFYRQDLRILEDLGFDVHVATTLREICIADLYFIWWWTWAFAPIATAKLFRRPSLITGVFDDWAYDGKPLVHRLLIRFALKFATSNVFLSEMECKQVASRFDVNSPCYCPLTVDTSRYRPSTQCLDKAVVTIAWLQKGNAERKCIPEVIRAAKIVRQKYPDIRFIIAGEKGTSYPQLKKIAVDLGAEDYIEFVGTITRETKIELLQRCQVYLSPSRFEGFGLAILEAMSCGAPVITSPVGAVPEVVRDCAILVDGTSPEAIATAICELLAGDDKRLELGQRSRARAETVFPYERRKSCLERILVSIMKDD